MVGGMTLSRKPPKPRADDYRPDVTLAQFSAEVDDHLNASVGFADHVLGLHRCRIIGKQISEWRKLTGLQMAVAYERGESRASVGGAVYELRRSAPSAVKVTRNAPSAEVKKASPTLWKAAHTIKPFATVKSDPLHPRRVDVPEGLQLPPLPTSEDSLATIIERRKAAPTDGALRDEEQEHIEALEKIAANAGWDGLPIEFSDRWLVGLRRLQYDSDRLREVDPAAWERLAVVKPTGGTTRLYVAEIGVMEADGAVDLDGE